MPVHILFHVRNIDAAVAGKELILIDVSCIQTAQNNFTIELTGTEKQTLLLCDVHGRVVLNQIISGKTNINTNDLMDGVYNISIINSIGTINKRLVIVK